MKLIVGLGNPGDKYADNRHNVGFKIVDRLGEELGLNDWENKFQSLIGKLPGVMLIKPQTFMNQSGKAVSEVVNFYKINTADLVVVHDDLDIKLGDYKVVNGVGPKVHNGLNSIESGLGRSDFWRVRVGIDNRIPEARKPGEEFVLEDFNEDEKMILKDVINSIIKDLKIVIG